jgi:putative peptidoglycan lipid II flippase
MPSAPGKSREDAEPKKRLAASFRRLACCVENRTAFRALINVGPFVLLARFVAMGKAMLIARAFGSGSSLDAFYIALLVPTVMINVVSGSIGAAFMPVYLDARRRGGAEAAKRLYDSVFAAVTFLIAACGVTLMLFSRQLFAILSPGFDEATRALATRLFLVLAPALVLSGIPAIWTAVLNAEGRFTVPALSRSISPLAYIVALVLLSREWGIYSLAAGTFAGAVAEVAVLAGALRRQGFSLTPRWHGLDADFRSVARQFIPGVTCGFWSSGAGLVDQSMASALPSGSVASLNYGSGLVGSAICVAGETFGTAMLPSFSRLVAAGAWADVRRVLKTYLCLAFAIGASGMLALIVLSRPLTALLYQHGAFSAADTDVVAGIQIALALQLPAILMAVVILRLLAAMQRTWVRSAGGIGNLVLNILFNYWLMRWFGVAGIALSTSLVCILSTAFLGWYLRRELKAAEKKVLGPGAMAPACPPVMADVN